MIQIINTSCNTWWRINALNLTLFFHPIGFDDDGKQVTLHAAEADIPGPPNNFVGVNAVDSNSQLDLELESIFTEGMNFNQCNIVAHSVRTFIH